MSVKTYLEKRAEKEQKQLSIMAQYPVPPGAIALTIGEDGKLTPVVPYVGDGDYAATPLMRLPSSLDMVQNILMHWQAETFDGRATKAGLMNHLVAEVEELRVAMEERQPGPIREEIADVFVVLTHLAALQGVDLGEVVLEKLQKLVQRDYTGEPDDEGKITHKKEA